MSPPAGVMYGLQLHVSVTVYFVLQVASDSNSAERYIRGAARILSVCAERSLSQKCDHPQKTCHEEISAEWRGVCTYTHDLLKCCEVF